MRAVLSLLAMLIVISAAATSAAAGDPKPPKSFRTSKKILAQIHEDIGYQTTLYCGCPYARTETDSGGDLDRETCGLKAKNDEKRSYRLEWEHVVPASWFGQARACWHTGHAKVRQIKRRCL